MNKSIFPILLSCTLVACGGGSSSTPASTPAASSVASSSLVASTISSASLAASSLAATSLAASSVASSLSSNLATSSASSAGSAESLSPSLVSNGTFDLDLGSWWSAVEWVGAATFPVINGEVALNITNGSNEEWHVMLGQNDIPIVKDQVYCLKLDARASVAFNLKLNVQQHGGAHTGYYSSTSVLGMAMKSFIYEFSSSQSDAAAQVQFNMGKQGTGTIWIDNFELRKKTQSSCQFASPTL